MTPIRWGILGPGSIARNFADGLRESASGRLVAIGSRSAARRDAFGERFGIEPARRHASYAALCGDPGVDAIHVATPHPFHAEQALMAIRAGKHVSVEKPAGLNAAEVTVLVEAAAAEGVFFMEALMYLSHPQIRRAVEIVREGTIGRVRHVRASFGFAAPFDAGSRLYDSALGGGGILDVGPYPVSAARLFAGVEDERFADPVSVKGVGSIGRSGVDEVAHALLAFENGVIAEIGCAVAREMDNALVVTGETGRLTLPDPWVPGRDAGPSDAGIVVAANGTEHVERLHCPEMLFAFEAEEASRAIADGRRGLAWPCMTPAASIGNNATLDRWRAEVGSVTVAEESGAVRRLPGTLPANLPPVPMATVPGLERAMSRLVLGCDNRETPAEGALVWDAWMEAGGNAFDTAFVYGAGHHEAVLGQWIASRGVAEEIVVIVKGAHTPYCVPDAVGVELELSLSRLGLERAPIYLLHRDDPAVPVGEFVDAVARERDAGRIGIWGGSNWTVERFAEAVRHAEANGLEPPRVLSNNLSLAAMERPVWPGCLSANTPETLAYLRDTATVHLGWSSQARGYFLPPALRERLPEATRPETCYASEENEERRRRAERLAAERGVSAHNVATAWALAQPFPSFALIGPRSPGEIASTLPGAALALEASEVRWLNLEDDR